MYFGWIFTFPQINKPLKPIYKKQKTLPGKNSVSRPTGLVHSSVSARRSRQLRQKFHPHGVPSEQLHFGMLSRDEVIIKERGENVELACEFNLEYYHAFDNPVIWLKSQVSEAKIKINSMAVIEEPFLGTRRFSVGWHKQPPRYWFTLTVKGNLDDWNGG